MNDLIEVRREGSRVEVILNRTDKKNALTGAMYNAVADALNDAENDDGVLTVIIAANGPDFCAGNDLVDFQTNPPKDGGSPVARFLHAISTNSKVLIAAVQGVAVGVGATMLLHCDHVVVSEGAALHFNFVKMALVPEAASSLLLPRVVGPLKAAEIMLAAVPVPAKEALAIGLVSRVVATGEELETAREFANAMSGMSPQALRITKRLLRSATNTVADRMAEESAYFRQQLASPDFREAVSAFLEKRKPTFGLS